MKPIHGAPVLKNIPADMVSEPPVPCEFMPGDNVVYTNDYGTKFHRKVMGFSPRVYSYGFIYLDTQAYWMPHKPEQLSKAES